MGEIILENWTVDFLTLSYYSDVGVLKFEVNPVLNEEKIIISRKKNVQGDTILEIVLLDY
jgi:hypothetical protein